MEVTVVGSLMMDLITYADNLPKTGETVFGTSFQTSFGGKGANQAVQCARLGVNTAMVGYVGVDGYGGEYLEQLTQEGVGIRGMSRSANVRTGTASIQVDSKGQNTIIIVQGANLEFLPESFAGLEDTIAQSAVVLCQNEIPFETTKHTLQLCQKHNTISVLNPAPASMRMLELLPYCDIFCPNETELASLSGLPTGSDDQIRAAGDKLLALGCKVLLVTLGARGACLIRPGEFVLFPLSQVVTPVDTVGAGDSFIGSLAANIARNVPFHDAVPRAILCASLSVTKKGAQGSCPTVADLQALQLQDGRRGAEMVPPAWGTDSAVADRKTAIRATLGL